MNDVGKFIAKFQSPESNNIFAGDCSYWFAAILYRRFIRDGAKIMIDKMLVEVLPRALEKLEEKDNE